MPAVAAVPHRAPLLAPDEPPPVELFNGTGRAAVLLVCDHASPRVPRVLGQLGLPPSAFGRHIAWDIGAADVARRLATALDAPLVLSGYSRLVIDLNRRLDDPTSIPAVSDGTAVPANRGITPDEARARATALFDPYHQAVVEVVGSFAARQVVPAIVSIHSCTPVFKGFERPWHIGILWNRDPRLAVPLIERLGAMGDIAVGDNQPYSARDGHGHTVAEHAERGGLPHVLLEVRQDFIDTHQGAARWADVLHHALAPLLAEPALHRVKVY
jgi:predicted N-formylglutamate amidohydrolase